jgi:hypothetical protein
MILGEVMTGKTTLLNMIIKSLEMDSKKDVIILFKE